MNTRLIPHLSVLGTAALFFLSANQGIGQTLVNVHFGAGAASPKTGFAATGQRTNDFWNLYSHYNPRFTPGMPPVSDGRLAPLKLADGSASGITLALTNAPGVWGNSTGDPMLDSYVFAPNGSNMLVTLTGLEPGRYHFYASGWAAADVSAEQNSAFTLRTGTNTLGPLTASGAAGWQVGQPWRERAQFVVFREVSVSADEPVTLEIAPGPGGVAVLNGLQILSRGTSPPRLAATERAAGLANITNLLFREIRYDGKLAASEARFAVSLDAESRSTNEISAVIFEGELAVLSPKLPTGWRIVNQGRQFILYASEPGANKLEFDLVARIQRAEPWNQIRFTGPPAAIATVKAQGTDTNVEVQLQSGTPVESSDASKNTALGVLGTDRELALRWQSKTAEAARDTLVTVDSKLVTRLTPTMIRHTSTFRYEILQARLSQLKLLLPADHALTRLTGDQVRDWRVTPDAAGQVLMVDFIRPIENAATLTLITEQPVPVLPGAALLRLPQPVGVQREAGAWSIEAEDIVPRVDSAAGLRQVNALAGEFAAFRFNSRPASLSLQLARVEPVIEVGARVTARLEETRLLVSHDLNLNVTRAGIYALELTAQTNFVVADVKGDGVEDWKTAGGKLRVTFGQRVLGQRKLSVQLERSLQETPSEILLLPLAVTGASKQTAFIGAGSVAGIQLKTATLDGAREIAVTALPDRRDELLAFRADAGDWRVTLFAERLLPRVVANVFNLITIGDGLVGGSATIRYGIVNQGVQQFRVRLPLHWRNVEFTGPNIRRKDQQGDTWTLALQDKAWNGYTLVITYDHTFDPKQATLDAAGAHPLEVERETGTTAITTAANLQLEPAPVAEPLRQIDPSELVATDRALITRPVLLAYRYEGTNYGLSLKLTRHTDVPVLDAVTDRAQFTSVLMPSGEMLSQASFMVKNNERQYQEFKLPPGAELWSAAVNGEPVKADKDGDLVLVTLPRGENRDELFAVDLKYKQQFGALGGWFPSRLDLVAPETKIPGTYVQWEVYVPSSRRVSGFGGNMVVANDTNYGFRDAWRQFSRTYADLWHDFGPGLMFGSLLVALVVALIAYGRRRGFAGVVSVFVVFAIFAILAGMMLPALSRAKAKAQRISSVNNLKQIGLAVRIYSADNRDKFPRTFEEMMNELGSPKIIIDPEDGQRYTYVGEGKNETDPNALLAYSANKNGHREVLLADGSVQQVTEARFSELLAKETQSLAQKPTQAPNQPAAIPAFQPQFGAGGNGFGGGRGGQGGPAGANAAPLTNGLANLMTAPATATGIKSLRFEIPRTGRVVSFKRVLSPTSEPPRISFSMIPMKVFICARTAFQLAAFLMGLVLVRMQWRREEPRAVWIAAGMTLALLGLSSLFLTWRMMGFVLIAIAPTLLAILVTWLLWHAWQRQTQRTSPPPPVPAISPTAATLLLLLILLFGQPTQAATPNPMAPNLVSIAGATLTGEAHERAAQFEVALDLVSSGTNQSAALFGKDVAVQEFISVSGDARLWREGESVGVLLPNRGPATVKLKLLVKLGGEPGRRQLDFALPPAIGTKLMLTLDEADAEVDFATAVSFTRRARDQKTFIEAVLGATPRLTLSWTPRLKRATEVAATVFAQQAALVTLGNGVANTRSVIEWQVSQGELLQVRVALPEGHRLLRVSGESLRAWDFADTNRSTLVLDFVKPMAPSVKLVFETEKALDQLPADVRVLLAHALDVKRETGLVAVRAGEELGLTVLRADSLERVDPTEFNRTYGDAALAVFSAWRFLRPEFDLSVRAEMLQPKLEATVRNQFIVGSEQIAVITHADFTIDRAGVFAVRLALPRAGRVEEVKCDAMQTWSERTENGARILEVLLKQRTLGVLSLDAQLVTPLTNLPPALALEGIHPLSVEKLTGYVIASAEPGVGLKTSTLTGATEIPAVSAPGVPPGATGVLAYKYLTTEAQPAPPWQLTLATELLQPWVRAEIASFATVSENLISGHATVRYDIQNAPLKEFRLRVPVTWRNVEIFGPGIRRRDHTTNEWRVELQTKVRGDYRLTVRWEEPRTGTNDAVLTGVEALGVERETGALGLFSQGQLQITPRLASDELLRIDASELPEWAADRPPGVPALSFHYLRPGWRLTLEGRRFQDATVLQALADSVHLRSVLAEDGQLMTQMTINVRNNGRQSLSLAMPAGMEVWSAFVGGQPVRPTKRNDRLLLPLEKLGTDDAPIAVELTFVGKVGFPRTSGRVKLESPKLDVPLKDARWDLYLPADFHYDGFKGSMTYESADAVPVAQDFTLAEYKRQEQAQEENYQSKASTIISNARKELAAGNFESQNTLNFINNGSFNVGNTRLSGRQAQINNDFANIQRDINRAQSSNLLNAQQAYSLENEARLNGGVVGQLQQLRPGSQAFGAYAQQVAEQQVAQLQKAQAVAVRRVTPLRVNLPTTGLRHTFAQPLQTETDKALTIQLKAHNDRESSWVAKAVWCLAGFLLLWAVAGVAVLLRPYRTALPT